MLRNRCGDESARAKPGNSESSDHAVFVRKPLNQGRQGNDVTQTEADAAQDPVTQREQQ